MKSTRKSILDDCLERQGGLCVVCGYYCKGFADLHESIIKRGDLPNDKRIFDEHNCVAVHHGSPCHENTKEKDRICIQYLIDHYGIDAIVDWIKSLEMVAEPGRAQEIMTLCEKRILQEEGV